ncbi:ABC transporter ATP-binding protein [Niallia sp. HCP3S3_B10]|uniref:ABC transporter ATP-binding protein n=1 Tax=Niallia sp. HCP3S3_B10 TaxID=3438944 RepID=UPI003F8BFBF8
MNKPIIEFKDFGFKYRSQSQPTLSNINLTIYEGEKVLIVGPSGSGKSTLAHCVNGLIPFSYEGEISGSLRIKEKETKSETIYELSQSVGTILQDTDTQFIGLTVGEDIAFVLENNQVSSKLMREKVMEAASLVGMEQYLDASIHQLSGGQKQRVALAGVLIQEVDILLFDEPLANLDPVAGKQAMHLIADIHKRHNNTIIIIEHRLEEVLEAEVDRILLIDHGTLIADLSPQELLTSSLLDKHRLRKPLYVKLLQDAGVRLPNHIPIHPLSMIPLKEYRQNVIKWFQGRSRELQRKKQATLLEVDKLSFTYPHQNRGIRNLSFSLEKGEMVSIVGKNGAGKSTLAKLISGFEVPKEGSIFLNGMDITKLTIKEKGQKIGFVLQNPNHMISKHLIKEEVALGLINQGMNPTEIEKRVKKVLNICGLLPYRKWPISALSYGQKKRVTIASILVLNPEILILDEPTAGQDLYHYTEIMDFLLELNRTGISLMIITHDMHLIQEYTSRTMVLADGEIIADSSPANILTNPQIMKAANLKETSLYEMAKLLQVESPSEFIDAFISYEQEGRKTWQKC